jgi:uncharacterized membrane protein YdjX (TVP38/TMEM64 family)
VKSFRPFSAHSPETAQGTGTTAAQNKKRRRPWLLAGVLAGLLALIAAVLWHADFEWGRIPRALGALNPFLVFALMSTLPVGGFSVGVIYLVAGAKFGPVLGGVTVAGATAIHLLLTHWIARSFLRGPLLRFLHRRHHHLPEIPPGENAAVAAMAALIPGIPYFARNYLLALSGMPLRTYFWICLPIYVARSYVTIFLGDLSGDPSRQRLLVLAAVYAVKLGICAVLLAHLRRRHKSRSELRASDTAAEQDSLPREKSRAKKKSRSVTQPR